jgi:ATP adenylyltransferase
MEYIRAPKKNNGTTFSSKLEKGTDEENLILFKGGHSFVCMNLYPYNNGHLLLVPYEIVDKPEDLNKEAMNEIMKISTMSMKILRENMNAEGFNFGANIGASAGAGIADHLHYHIVPRWGGDTNFMPVVGNTKVHVQGLQDTYDDLIPYFQKIHKGT